MSSVPGPKGGDVLALPLLVDRFSGGAKSFWLLVSVRSWKDEGGRFSFGNENRLFSKIAIVSNRVMTVSGSRFNAESVIRWKYH